MSCYALANIDPSLDLKVGNELKRPVRLNNHIEFSCQPPPLEITLTFREGASSEDLRQCCQRVFAPLGRCAVEFFYGAEENMNSKAIYSSPA